MIISKRKLKIVQITYLIFIITPAILACECSTTIKTHNTENNTKNIVKEHKNKNPKDKINNALNPQVFYLEKYKNIQFVSVEKCKLCHSIEYRKWQNTKHAKAYENMVNEFENITHLPINSSIHQPIYSSSNIPSYSSTTLSDCEPCHTTGYGYRFGFKDKQISNNLAGVQCEDCHGPGGEHIKNPKQIKMACGDTPIKETLCRNCHKQYVMKGFEVGKYIKEIRCD